MKRQLYIWTAPLLALLLAACGDQAMTTELPEPEQPVVQPLTIHVEVDPTANGEETTRAGGNNAIPTGYKLRYILEVYAEGKEQPITRTAQFGTDYTAPTFSDVRLPAGAAYTAVCWADFMPTASDLTANGTFYNANALTAIQQLVPAVVLGANDTEARDAYAGKLSFTVDAAGVATPSSLAFTLRRPLVRLEMSKLILTGAATGNYRIKYATAIPDTYNALSQSVATPSSSSRLLSAFATVTAPSTTSFPLVDYLFVDADGQEVGISVSNLTETEEYFKNDAPINLTLSKPNMKVTVHGTEQSPGIYNDLTLTQK